MNKEEVEFYGGISSCDYSECCRFVEKAYQKGRDAYEKECEELFNENPPMHFTEEQIMWIKARMKLSRQQGREDAIEYYSELLKKEIVTKRNEELDHIDSLEDRILQNLKGLKN